MIVIVIILRAILDNIMRLWQLVGINVICDIGLRAYSRDNYSDDEIPNRDGDICECSCRKQ